MTALTVALLWVNGWHYEFNEFCNVTKNYFCDQVPPVTPVVIEEILAEGGEVLITTIQSETDTTIYEHTIELSGISLVNSQGERITNLNIDNFGTITTQEESE